MWIESNSKRIFNYQQTRLASLEAWRIVVNRGSMQKQLIFVSFQRVQIKELNLETRITLGEINRFELTRGLVLVIDRFQWIFFTVPIYLCIIRIIYYNIEVDQTIATRFTIICKLWVFRTSSSSLSPLSISFWTPSINVLRISASSPSSLGITSVLCWLYSSWNV